MSVELVPPVDDDSSFEPEQRFLCVDDLCIGLVGSDSCCRICHRLNPEAKAYAAAHPAAPALALVTTSEHQIEAQPDSVSPLVPDLSANSDASSEDGDDFAERVLCSDATCIGVINSDGHCRDCGKPAA